MSELKCSVAGWQDRVHACWIGKNIAGALGAPYEGSPQTHALTFYDPQIAVEWKNI